MWRKTMYKKTLIILSKFIIAITTAIILFNFIQFPFELLLMISILIVLYCFFSFQKNSKNFICETTLLMIAIILGYIITTKTFYQYETKYIIATLIIISFYMYGILCKDKNEKNTSEVHLFEQQKNDISRLGNYINSYNSVGINGEWGTGKSYITDFLIKQNNNKYIPVVISLLTCDVDNIAEILMDRLSSVMKNNLIYSKYANQIVHAFKNTGIVQSILSLFWKNNYSYGDIFDGFKIECAALDKPVLIVFEDIDRIKNKENLTSLFSVAEKLACNKIKIIYQYDENHMQEIGYNRMYLEKYIPYQVDITRIEMFDIIRFFLTDYYHIEEDDFKTLTFRISCGFDITIGARSMNIGFNKINYSIRRIKIFLDELNNCFNKNAEIFNNKDDRELAVSFFFIKHCLNSVYQEIKDGSQLLEHLDIMKVLLIQDGDNYYSIQEFIDKVNSKKLFSYKIDGIFDNYDNRDRFIALLILGFELDYKLPEARKSDDMYILTHKNLSEKRNRLIWYLIYGGESEYTNYEAAAKCFTEDVLSKPLCGQKQAYNDFWNCMFYESVYKNNGTIQKIGERGTTCIFKALYVAQTVVSSDDWIKWIDLYLDLDSVKNINYRLIKDIYYCNIYDNKVYIHMLNRFNNLKITGNMNNDKIYKRFLIKYLRVLSILGYIDTYDIDYFRPDTDDIDIQMTLAGLDVFKRKLEELKRNIGNTVNQIKNDIETIIQFVEKNKELINTAESLERPKSSRVSTSPTTRFIHQDEFDILLSIQDNKKFLQELNKSYNDNNISAYEVQELLKKRNNK